ncbi:hypothetical protein RYX36_019556 [Vicia faba]
MKPHYSPSSIQRRDLQFCLYQFLNNSPILLWIRSHTKRMNSMEKRKVLSLPTGENVWCFKLR